MLLDMFSHGVTITCQRKNSKYDYETMPSVPKTKQLIIHVTTNKICRWLLLGFIFSVLWSFETTKISKPCPLDKIRTKFLHFLISSLHWQFGTFRKQRTICSFLLRENHNSGPPWMIWYFPCMKSLQAQFSVNCTCSVLHLCPKKHMTWSRQQFWSGCGF